MRQTLFICLVPWMASSLSMEGEKGVKGSARLTNMIRCTCMKQSGATTGHVHSQETMCNPEYQSRSQMHLASRKSGCRIVSGAGFCKANARGDADSLRAKNSRSSFRPCPKPPLAQSPFQPRSAATPLRRTSHCKDKHITTSTAPCAWQIRFHTLRLQSQL